MTDATRKQIVKWFWIVIAAPFALVIFLLLMVAVFTKIPSFEELEHPDSKLATQLIAENGEVLSTFHIENRTYVDFETLPDHLVQAAVATEDVRFYKHSGIDFKSLARVAVKTLIMHDRSQGGGSTITQQLAKTLYPREKAGKLRIVFIKLKEWITAVKLERAYTKEEIITMYLNSFEFGNQAYGIKTASETLFAKDPSMLTMEESAMIVGMLNNPTKYNPVRHPELALQRRNIVLGRMKRAGYIDKAVCDSVSQIPIDVSHFEVKDHNAGLAPYFRDMLRRDMKAEKPKRSNYQNPEEYSADSLRWRDDPIYGWLNKNKKSDGTPYNLDRDGLRIYTTINYKMQKYAEEAVAEHMGKTVQKNFNQELRWKANKPFSNDVDKETIDRVMNQARKWSDRWRLAKKAGRTDAEILAQFKEPAKMRLFAWNKKGYVDTTMTPDDSIRYCKSILRTGFVAIEPHTGYVKAYVGGPNYRYFKFDNVRQGKRQVGSTIKPFLYTLAMMEGYNPCDRVVCMPQTFDMPDGSTWTPRSTDKAEWIGQTVTLRWGLANSSNNISAFLMSRLGPAALVRMAHRMGVPDHLEEVYSLCVGSAEVEIFNMVAAFNTYPSGGVYIYPKYVTRIEDSNGNVITDCSNRKRDAISPATAYLMVNLMQAVVDGGTGSRLRSVYGLKGHIAGKTGTTNDNSDGWFIGYTPKITAGAWVGGEDRQVHFQSTAYGQGASMALPIWGIWYRKCLADPTLDFSDSDVFIAPPGVSLNLNCDEQGVFLGGYGANSDGGNTGAHDEEEDYYFN